MSIEDISSFVQEQHQHVKAGRYDDLRTPLEMIYPVEAADTARKLGLSTGI